MQNEDLNPDDYDFRWELQVEQRSDELAIGRVFDIKVLVFEDYKYIITQQGDHIYMEGVFIPYKYHYNEYLIYKIDVFI